ncbi:hypothetical protein [Microlunatus sp. GCM10028923]|uniref:hypothetical protein n=1 Tax=Microlunatus sp. GCM10028923 TaxID=3273400 RepID=UPI003623CEB8
MSQPQYHQPYGYGQQSPYPPQPYPYQQPSPYGYLPAEHPQGTTILVLGIVGFFVFPCGIVAWYMGNKAMKEIQASGIRYGNESNVNIGRILGMVTTILGIVGVALALAYVVFWFVLMFGMMASVTATY